MSKKLETSLNEKVRAMSFMTDRGRGERTVKGGPTSSRLFWIDLETSALDYTTCKIFEVFVLVTDQNLQPIDTFEAVVHYNESDLKSVSRWAQNQHRTLLELVETSTMTLSDVERRLANFFDQYRQNKKAVLAGSSVYFDRLCLEHHMPALVSRIHYRVVDVSTLMELAKRWSPSLHQFAPLKSVSHRARDDVYSSLNLLMFYRQYFIQPQYHAVNLP
jgi:oligoribonuclease